MSKQSIKQTIDLNVYQNGQQRITGNVMNAVLKEMVDDTYSGLEDLSSRFPEFIDGSESIIMWNDRKYLLIRIIDDLTSAMLGAAVCGSAICGTN